jgi:tetratricopeptide (TPR) repeat protein
MFALGLGALEALPALSQGSPQRELTVVVVNAHADPSQPVPGVRVSLSFVAGSEKVTDSRDATNRQGQALLVVSPEAAQRDDLRVEITGVSDLVVFQPADGQLSGLPSTVTVRLLPKGSVLLLGPPQIEAMLQRLSIQARAKNQEIHALKAELAAAQGQKPDDLTAAMTEWAKANGFAAADVDKQVQQWAEDIQRHKDQATANEKALAELALKHYGVAAQLFDQAADDIGQSMDEEEKKFLEERRTQLRELVDKKFQSANTYQLNLQFHQATQILAQARDRAAAEHGRYPEDAALRGIWLDAELRLANARRDEGEFGEASASAALLTQSIKDYQVLLQERSAPGERQDWAMAQTNLAIALVDQAVRSSGAQATDLLAQAAKAYRGALEVYTKTDQPKEWARTQSNMGNALVEQGDRSSGAQTAELFAQAVLAFRAALEVRTKAELAQEWATTQSNLGIALVGQGDRSSGPQALDLLAQAVQAFRAALEVQTKTDLPLDWARTENGLGIALSEQGARSSGTRATDLFAQAVQAYRAALEVRTKANLPQVWATTQNNLGAALVDQVERSSEAQATDLLAQAIEAYRAALEVYTKADLPQDWASTENNLGVALVDQGERSSGAPAQDLFTQAVQAHRAALEVRTKADLPQDWAQTQNDLGLALRYQAAQSSGAQAKDLLAEAVQAYRAALEVYTRADLPSDWAATQNNMGNALVDQGDFADAAKALESCLEVFPDNVEFLQTAVFIYQENLYRYDRAYELSERWLKADASPDARLGMAEADLTTNRFEDCGKQVEAIDNAASLAPDAATILIGDSMKLACQWGAGQKAAARETGKALLLKSAQLQDKDFDFAGTRHFIDSSPAFAAGRASWSALFESLEKGDGAAMAGALQQLEEVMQN